MGIAEAHDLIMPGIGPKLGLLKGFVRYAKRRPERKRLGRDPYLTMGQALASACVSRSRSGTCRCGCGAPSGPWSPTVGASSVPNSHGGAARTGSGPEPECSWPQVVSNGARRCGTSIFEVRPRPTGRSAMPGTSVTASSSVKKREGQSTLISCGRPGGRRPSSHPSSRPHGCWSSRRVSPMGSLSTGTGTGSQTKRQITSDVGRAMFEADDDSGAGVPAWWIFDATYRRRYVVGPIQPGSVRA